MNSRSRLWGAPTSASIHGLGSAQRPRHNLLARISMFIGRLGGQEAEIVSGFDKSRFAESFVASLLGTAAYDFLQGDNGSLSGVEIARRFQRSLLVAMNHNGFTEDIAARYLERVGNLSQSQRKRYMRVTLQPSETDFDEGLTSVVIFDNALKSDKDWDGFLRAFSLETRSPFEAASSGVKSALNQTGNDVRGYIRTEYEKVLAEDERLSRTWYGRIYLRYLKLVSW